MILESKPVSPELRIPERDFSRPQIHRNYVRPMRTNGTTPVYHYLIWQAVNAPRK